MINTLPQLTVVIFRMDKVPYIDQSGIYALEDAVIALKERNIIVLLTGIESQPRAMLENVGFIPGLIPTPPFI